ncbi:MAG: glycerol-3-phosphate dehydrogenase, partial [Clostridia bacterium]|nr:glycerol-3-phosphate dehydrogenase [Clostridia bacterium]
GMMAGQGYGDNGRAALVTRGIAEMIRYGVVKGGKKETYIGLTGIGDLVVTCFSVHSRNYQAGYIIGSDDSAERFFRENTRTVEGVYSCKVIYEDLAANYDFEMPIITAVYDVLFHGKRPSEAIAELMSRPLVMEGN